MSDKRPDELDDFSKDPQNFSTESSQQMLSLDTKLDSKEEDEIRFEIKVGKLKKAFLFLVNIFCGFSSNEDQADLKHQQIDESNRRKETFWSLGQTRFERLILNFNLFIILVVAVFFYVFFSIPPEYHIFNHVHLNRTWLNNN